MQDLSTSMQDVLGHHAGGPGGLHARQDISVPKAIHVGPSRSRMRTAKSRGCRILSEWPRDDLATTSPRPDRTTAETKPAAHHNHK